MDKYSLTSKILLFLSYGLTSGLGLLILKSSMTGVQLTFKSLLNQFFTINFIIGFSLYTVGFIIWMIILSIYDLSRAFPIAMSIFFIISTAGSIIVLHESFSYVHIIGAILCLFGILMISHS